MSLGTSRATSTREFQLLNTGTITSTGTQSYTIPAGTFYLEIELWAGGGGGSASNKASGETGGSGGSGIVAVRLNPIFSASNVWSLKKVFEEIKDDNWGLPS